MSATVWLCGRCGEQVEINGIFSTRELAVSACTSPRDYIVPMPLDERLPEEPLPMPGVEYPLLVKEQP